ncbi:related to NADPH-dependent methylglyoxal reductase GRE2 [Saccharomycodes ludwigii]|uniref:Related to NADPH-dependent methylglyoxal reductase GRE2 n=1 Tax=Saccharomycodes ludwigii TaxID=36035 RepID=A0A376B9R7_9ASCO|nr:hypothetical protein SCDLUD_005264 [Saccharomycodes ludwigii]KAH3898919.1 hypothetical protein SCDLUD_005264 [Saccharomycodes ludwigii]SSD61416.1 related to NADPH-dependent methylglyoxal reductase GRE2 [Saccharomycodes ludwigii]
MSQPSFKKIVFVSGATGFIAKHIIGQLLETGEYKVIGSVRSQEKAELVQNLFSLDYDLSLLEFAIVPDISKVDAFDEAFIKYGREIEYVVHTASPLFFHAEKSIENEILIPAVNGVKSILSAIQLYGPNVKKFVFMSSFAACGTKEFDSVSRNFINEETWNSISWEESKESGYKAYYGGKTFSEKYCWHFVKENNPHFKVSTILPTYVFGRQKFEEDVKQKLNLSCEFINEIVHSKPNTIVDNNLCRSFIDVEDVGKTVLQCLKDNNLENQRLLLSNGRFTLQTIVNEINESFPQLRGKIAQPVYGIDEDKIKTMATLDNNKTKKLLGFQFKSFHACICDTVSQILATEKKMGCQ